MYVTKLVYNFHDTKSATEMGRYHVRSEKEHTLQDGAQNVEPFQFCLVFVFCRKMLHVTTPVVAQKYGELFLVHRLFSVTTILSQDLFNTNVRVYS